MRSGYVRGIANLSVISALAGLLAACGGGGMSLGNFGSSSSPVTTEPGVEPEMPATIKSQELVGKWGLASFQNPNDRARTEKQAAAQCKQPYVIGARQSAGVGMHLADPAPPPELRVKGSPTGKHHRGPPAPPAGEHDHEIVSFDPRTPLTRFTTHDAPTGRLHSAQLSCGH